MMRDNVPPKIKNPSVNVDNIGKIDFVLLSHEYHLII